MKRTCVGCGLNRQVASFTGPRGKTCAVCRKKTRQRSSKARSLWLRYRITLEEWEALLEAQGGVCGACGESRAPGYAWCVDHDHAVEKVLGVRASVRGLVCRRCNKVLRDVRDAVRVLEGLIQYLQCPPAKEIL